VPDPILSKLLRSWKVDGSLPQGFQSEVRHRIAHNQVPRTRSLADGLAAFVRAISMLQRPTFAVAYITAGILVGALSGSRHAHSTYSRSALPEGDPQVRYIASIDPYQMPRSSPP